MSEKDRFNHKLVPYLINFVPFRINCLFDDFGSEELITQLDDAIRVWLSFYQATQKLVLPYQVLCLQKVNPQNTLQQKHTSYKYSVYIHMYACVCEVYKCVTFGMGKRSLEICASFTSGIVILFGSTRKLYMISWIMLSHKPLWKTERKRDQWWC